MLSERALRRIAGAAGLGVGQCEHEYVMLCALDALSRTPLLADTFCLKGGTALRLAYFADWRHSVDLDFSVLPALQAESLRAGLDDWFTRIVALHGIDVRLRDFHPVNGAARARVRFEGPLRHPSRLLLDITLDEPILLPVQRHQVVTTMFDDLLPQVLCYSLEEILAEKLRSILERGKARDYYDVWRLLGEKTEAFDPSLVRQVLDEKFSHKGLSQPEVSAFLDPALATTAGAYWTRDLVDQVPGSVLPGWEDVLQDLDHLLTDFLK